MTKPILESIAKVLVTNERNQALILTVGEYKARPDKSFKPDLPGGLVDPSESEVEAAVRELREETGIEVGPSSLELLYARTEFFEPEHKSVSKFLYRVTLSNTPEVVISWEHAKYEWVPLENVRDVELRPFYREAVEYCSSYNLL